MAKKKQQYDASSITIQEDTEGLRHSITMYLGRLGDEMVERLVKEPRDNAYDEWIASRNKFVEQYSDPENNFYMVADGGKGIPIGIKKLKNGTSINTLTAIFTKAHAGGKMDNKAYKSSAGTHGVGAAASNAACEKLVVYTNFNGKWHTQEYKKGEPVKDVAVIKSPPRNITKLLTKKIKSYGTIVVMVPDMTVVSIDAEKGNKSTTKKLTPAKMNLERNETALADLSLINKGLEVVSTQVDKAGGVSTATYINKKDIAEIIRNTSELHELKLDSRNHFIFESQDISVALNWTSSATDDSYFKSYVNASITADGGTHVAGLRDALFAALKPYMPKSKGKTKPIKLNSVMCGILGFINWRMHGAQYDSQVKDKLVSKVDKEVREALEVPLSQYFNKNKTLARKLVKRAEETEKAIEAMQKSLRSITEIRKKSKSALPECLFACRDAKPTERQLFIVEGDSAGGNAKYARNSSYQELFKLRGKIKNCLDASLPTILESKVIQDLIIALGFDLKDLDVKSENPTFDVSKCRVNQAMILTDADSDGFHIATLLTTFFYRVCPEFINQGRLRFIQTPLFFTEYKGKYYGAMSIEDDVDRHGNKVVGLRSLLPANAKYDITRAKGLGELNIEHLRVFAFDPATRIEIQINGFESKAGELWYRAIAKESTEAKRKLLGISNEGEE